MPKLLLLLCAIAIFIGFSNACHYRTAYLSANDTGGGNVGFTIKIARSTANCAVSEYQTASFDQGLGMGYQNFIQSTSTDLATYRLFLDQTYQYSIGGNYTYVYSASGYLLYPAGTTVVDAGLKLNKRNTNVQNLLDVNSLSQATVHLILGSGYTAPQVSMPDIIYLPFGTNVQDFDLGVTSTSSVNCTDVTADNGELGQIICGPSPLAVATDCTIDWDITDTASCQAGMQWYIRFQAIDAVGNSITMETIIAIIDQPPPVCSITNAPMQGTTFANPYIYYCTYGLACGGNSYSVQMLVTSSIAGDTIEVQRSDDSITPTTGNNYDVTGTYPSTLLTVYTKSSYFMETLYRFQTHCTYYFEVRQYAGFQLHAYLDRNENGLQDLPQDTDQSGIIVTAYFHNCADSTPASIVNPQGSCTTDASGLCTISSLLPDTCYAFILTLPAQTIVTPTYPTAQNTFDPSTLQMGMAAPLSDNELLTGYAGTGQFGTLNVVSWFDSASSSCQANGQQDSNEGSASSIGIEVQITGPVNVDRFADFSTSLMAGSYTVQVIIPSSYSFTLYQVGPQATWNDINSAGQGSFTISPNQASRLGIGIVQPQINFITPTSTTIWQMYLAQKIEFCKTAAVGTYDLQIDVTNNANHPVFTIVTFWDGIPGSATRPLTTADTFTYWIPHNHIPGTYYLCAKFTDSASQSYSFCSQKFYWAVRI